MKKKVVVNASNLHVGGGVQVAVSFLSELAYIGEKDLDIRLVVSSTIFKLLKKDVVNFFNSIEVFDSGFFPFKKPKSITNDIDTVFSIFGPIYFSVKCNHIVGFALPTLIYPENEIQKNRSVFSSLNQKLKLAIKKKCFNKADTFIVELEHVQNGLKNLNFKQDIHVIKNCASNIYKEPHSWQDLKFPKSTRSNLFRLGFLGRDYPHKNTDYLLHLKNNLKINFNLEVEVYVTFTEKEWNNKSKDFRENILNVGSLSVFQCPNFYNQIDALVFPSFLECFSATPLEAMLMRKPVFASNKKFNRDVCGEHAIYFDPLDSFSCSESIYAYISLSKEEKEIKVTNALEHALSFSSAEERALKYLELLRKI